METWPGLLDDPAARKRQLLIDYARVSTIHVSLDRQFGALRAARRAATSNPP
jgi:hypothetical protein